MADTTLTPKSVRIAEDEAKWLSAAATKGAVTQNDLIRLAVHRLRKDLGAASRLKPETIVATAKDSKYKLTPPRTAASAASRSPTRLHLCPGTERRRPRRPLRAPGELAPPERFSRSRGIDGASPMRAHPRERGSAGDLAARGPRRAPVAHRARSRARSGCHSRPTPARPAPDTRSGGELVRDRPGERGSLARTRVAAHLIPRFH
jgi:hypothetical protein